MAKGDETAHAELLDRLDDQAVLAEIRAKNLALRESAPTTTRRAPPARAGRHASSPETTRRQQ